MKNYFKRMLPVLLAIAAVFTITASPLTAAEKFTDVPEMNGTPKPFMTWPIFGFLGWWVGDNWAQRARSGGIYLVKSRPMAGVKSPFGR